jgi:monovalent cation:proton antiporter-2 (CPA2) family protein
MDSIMNQAILYLVTMVAVAPIAKRLGLGAVLGYLIAGAVLGPHALSWVGGTPEARESVLHLAEFGVIMMLFLIGLELKPALLWKLRGQIFGTGTLQVLSTTAVGMGVAMAFGASWQVGLACGMTLSLSSTAIVLQTLQERGLLKSTGGEVSFSVLLFQDIAVIPILALFPLLAPQIASGSGGSSGAFQALKIAGGMALVIVAGRTLVRPVFRLVAQSNLRELFTALALVVVLATAALMHAVDLSPALGAFLAGVVLAESEYRHQLETDIEPFKGILLAIFFSRSAPE